MNTQVCDPRPRSALGTRGRASVCPVEVVLGGHSPEDAWLTALGKGWAEEGDRKRESEERPGRGRDTKVAPSLCPTLSHWTRLYSPWNSPARTLEWGALPFPRGSSRPRIEPRSPSLQADALTSESPGNQPRQYIKRERHYFAKRGPSSQSYDFSNSHVWM